MQWNISSVQHNGDLSTIMGFSPVNHDSCIRVIITRTTLNDALNIEGQRFYGNYHEGYAITVINPDEVYIIDIDMYNHVNDYLDMQNGQFIPINNAINFFDDYLYMGLNRLVFLNVIGMMTVNV